MPKLWSETVGAHRAEVREAILAAAAGLAADQGPLSVTMSQIAAQAGIGRATLYKYFPDVESVLLAWHDQHVAGHLRELGELAGRAGPAGDRLATVLAAYAAIVSKRPRADLAALLHRDAHVVRAERDLAALIRDLIAEACEAGDIRRDVSPEELAVYCVHALSAAADLRSKAAVGRLVAVTLAGLRPAA